LRQPFLTYNILENKKYRGKFETGLLLVRNVIVATRDAKCVALRCIFPKTLLADALRKIKE
jgi:hypothetical protein